MLALSAPAISPQVLLEELLAVLLRHMRLWASALA